MLRIRSPGQVDWPPWYRIPGMQTWSVSRKEYWEASAVSLMVLVALLPSAWWLHSQALPDGLLREGGVYESGSALASLVASILFFRSAIRASSRPARFWFALFALGCFVLAGEEISWGQHLIGFKPPDFIAEANYQGEFNVHNLSTFQSENNLVSSLLFRGLMLYLIVFPIAASVFPTLDRLLHRISIPLPGLAIALAALLVKGADLLNHEIVYGSSFATDTLHLGEMVESLYQFCVLWLAIQVGTPGTDGDPRTSRGRPPVEHH